MTGIVDDGGARRQADQALAVPVEPVARLDPTGFDPSRKVKDLCLLVTRHIAEDPSAARLVLEAVANGQDIAREFMNTAYSTKDWAMQCAIGLAVGKRLDTGMKQTFAKGIAKGIRPEVASPNERKILALASGTLTEGGDAKQAPGESLSGPVAKPDAKDIAHD